MVPLVSVPFRGRVQGRAQGRRNATRTQGGGVAIREWWVWHTTRPFFAVTVRVFRPRPDDTRRASGEGLDGSDPPLFDRWRGQPMGVVWHQAWHLVWHTHPPPGGSLPSVCIPAGRLPGPHAGRTISHTDRPDA